MNTTLACPLIRATLLMLPTATVTKRDCRPWHSSGLSGERMTIGLRLVGDDAADRIGQFTALLPEADLPLDRKFVADIAVRKVTHRAGDALFEIEALILNE
jgi:hypothetical protein